MDQFRLHCYDNLWVMGETDVVMGFNATFNNISVISWRSILLVEETGVPGETIDLPQVTEKLYHKMLYQVHLDISGVSNLQI